MNYGMIFYVLGWLLNLEALLMAPSAVVALIYREKDGVAILVSMLVCLALGLVITRIKPKKQRLYSREGFIIVAVSWFVLSYFGALPFRISGYIPHMIDAVFETSSGFTTTGASILTDVEALPHCLLFWRSFTHWIGGMGILVFLIAIVPMARGGSDMYLMKAESPGPSVKKLVPKVKDTAVALYKMYVAITLLELVLLLLGRMPVFDALTLTFGTAGTGGFGVRNDSVASYTLYQQIVITVFMILFGVNFSAYHLLFKRRFKEILQMSEVVVYFIIIAVAIGLITINITHYGMYDHVGMALKDAAFQVGSIITTTGYSTANFDLWPTLSKAVLVLLMFIGACAGSTGGGIKVSRLIIMAKELTRELDFVIHPNSVRKIKVDGKQLEHNVKRSAHAFLAAYVVVYVVSFLIVCLDNMDLISSFTAVAATINNIGPGLGIVGPSANFSSLSYLSKSVLIFDMIAGRLEIIPVLVFLSRRTWTK